MGLRYRVPLPGPFYYSGRVGPKCWASRSSGSTGCGPMGFIVKWFIVYPGIVFFGVGFAIVAVPFYGVFWVVRRWVRHCDRCRSVARPVAPCFPVQRPLPQSPAGRPVSGLYGFVLDRRPVLPFPCGFVPVRQSVPSSGVRRG